MANVELGTDVVELTLPDVLRHSQTGELSIPTQNPALLPLSDLDPEVFERLIAEIVSRRNNIGVQFYGRRGQKQYGLDVVERETPSARILYQVKRFEELTGAKLREAADEYAGPPRPPGYRGKARKFSPRRFVIVTSAGLDRDTENVDALEALQTKYAGDLEIDAWGAEALSRMLRDMPYLVYAVFGPQWAKAYCGYEPSPSNPAAPKSLGLVEDPIAVLQLDALETDATQAEPTDPLQASRLFGRVAEGLLQGNFPGHATEMRRRQAKAAQAGGDHATAFKVLFDLALQRVLAGSTSTVRSLLSNLESLAPHRGDVEQAELSALTCAANWYGEGSNLNKSVSALRTLVKAKALRAGLFSCLLLEQAVVDGLYDFIPARSVVTATDQHTTARLIELRDLASAATSPDVEIRARLLCAVADASLAATAGPDEVDAVYRRGVDDALAGRFLRARGLVASRAAYAFATHGDVERADSYWRQAAIASSEESYYGDALGAMWSSRLQEWDRGRFDLPGLQPIANALPNRHRLLAASYDPELEAMQAAHRDRLPDAFESTRRYLWERRLAGHLQGEILALKLFGEVLEASGHPLDALECYIRSGEASQAKKVAQGLPETVDVSMWVESPLRRRRAAAVQVIGVQSSTVPDNDVPEVIETLLEVAEGVWHAPAFQVRPERDALEAIARFGTRIPEAAVDRVLTTAEPALENSTRISDIIANLLVQTYWAVESRRQDVAAAIGQMLRLPQPNPDLWNLVEEIPGEAREPLLRVVTALAEQGQQSAIEALASWGIATQSVQLAARRACAALLRRRVGVPRTMTSMGTQQSTTVNLLLTLLAADELVQFSPGEFTLHKSRPAGGVLAAHQTFSPTDSPSSTNAEINSGDDALDSTAYIAAGPPGEITVALASHMTAIIEDSQQGAAFRAETARALRCLVLQIPRVTARGLALRLIAVQRTPNYSKTDQLEIDSNHPLSRFKLNTGANRLPALALAASAEMFASSFESDAVIKHEEREFAQEAIASSMPLLREEDKNTRRLGASTVVAIASSLREFAEYAAGLVFHDDEVVRARGAACGPFTAAMFAKLAEDPSAEVRAAIASRGKELPLAVREKLASDTHLNVRRILERSISTS
ncbi:hypothetical protein [Streptomyces sp. STR69]|uniref:hypothetical protein n=1 Tax=Streptomyces sp. STR69 TaxID=1796942 RepID=UPI0021C75063|nr:hypothetical protein [Streptomyces sp. STR69]